MLTNKPESCLVRTQVLLLSSVRVRVEELSGVEIGSTSVAPGTDGIGSSAVRLCGVYVGSTLVPSSSEELASLSSEKKNGKREIIL